MQASSLTSRIKRCLTVRGWLWWRLDVTLRFYVGFVPAAALVVIGVAAAQADWRMSDLGKFLLLTCCGVISVASTPRIMYEFPGLTKDFSAIWVLPIAILLPPFYAAIVPIFLSTALNLFVHRGVLHRAVFSAASQSLGYAAASEAFRFFPPSFAGDRVGFGTHAFTWCVAVAICEIVGSRGHHFMILGAVKLSAPQVKIWKMEWDRESLQALFVEMDLGILITLAVALSPVLVLIAVPTVLLVRRFLVFPVLEEQSRIDHKTGLLNVSTWESEAENEISRSIRTRNPAALALVDIDHFKRVNDTHGHLVGDKVLKAVAEALSGDLRGYDRAGRFGGEEFVILLAQTGEDDAIRIADRLRAKVADLAVPVNDHPGASVVRVTISIGVTALERDQTRELNDLLAAADSALYHAKQNGRNRVAVAAAERNMLEAELNGHRVAVVQVDPSGASLGPATSL
jgi:diguanylate cyclase (GGDEF)-like protein